MEDTTSAAREYLNGLVKRAFQADPFQSLCTLLRVDGASDPDWDPFEESHKAFDDFNWLLGEAAKHRGEGAHRRLALLTYCHAVEMGAAHELLVNLLRVVSGKPYQLAPLSYLRVMRKSGDVVPPSAKRKFKAIRELAEAGGESKLSGLIDSFFNEDVRNAYSHSDYVFAPGELRWTQSSKTHRMALNDLHVLLGNCFSFYSTLLGLRRQALRTLANGRRYHKWPRYEVLELVTDPDEGLVCGFHIHQSNGSKCTFTRTARGVMPINLRFGPDGVGLQIGDLDALEPIHKVNGTPVADWDALEAAPKGKQR